MTLNIEKTLVGLQQSLHFQVVFINNNVITPVSV